jgi:hypothetical protein
MQHFYGLSNIPKPQRVNTVDRIIVHMEAYIAAIAIPSWIPTCTSPGLRIAVTHSVMSHSLALARRLLSDDPEVATTLPKASNTLLSTELPAALVSAATLPTAGLYAKVPAMPPLGKVPLQRWRVSSRLSQSGYHTQPTHSTKPTRCRMPLNLRLLLAAIMLAIRLVRSYVADTSEA